MLTLVTGGSASGKSEYAENLLCKICQGEKLYIAAMQPHSVNDVEFKARVARHRELREGKGFCTVERYTALADLPIQPCEAALLECMSNLCANEFFSLSGACNENKASQNTAYSTALTAVLAGIQHLCSQINEVVVVTNEIFSDGCSYDEPTLAYIRLLGEMNRELARRAECVVEVVYGIPMIHKNERGLAL